MKPAFKRQLCVSPLYIIKLPIFSLLYSSHFSSSYSIHCLNHFCFVLFFSFYVHIFSLSLYLFIITPFAITTIFSFSIRTLSSVVYHLLSVFLVRAPLRDKYGFSCLNNLLIMVILNDTHWCVTSQTFFSDLAMLRNTWLWMFISAIVIYFFSVYFLLLKNLYYYCYFYKYLSVSSRFLHWILRYYLLYFLATSSLGHCYLTCEEFFILCILTLSLFLYWEYFKYYESVNFYSQDFIIF